MKYKQLALFAVIVLVVSLAVGLGVNAFSGSATKVFENVGVYNEAPEAAAPAIGAASNDSTSPWSCQAGVCEYIVSASVKDATTTIFSVANPWGVTASTTVVDTVQFKPTGAATSSYTLACGAATTPYAAPTIALLSSGSVATSTPANFIVENDIPTAQNGNSLHPGGGSVAKIVMTKLHPYFNCKVTVATAYDGAFLDGGNSFDGKVTVKFRVVR